MKSLALLLSLTLSPVFASNPDRIWIENKLSSVYRSFVSYDDTKQMLLRELSLFSDDEIYYAREVLSGKCAKELRKKEKRRDSYIIQECEKLQGIVKTPQYPKSLVLKALDALKELGNRGYVVLENGAMYRETIYWDRTGVMTEETFDKLTNGTFGHNLVGCKHSITVEGHEYQWHCDLQAAIDYLEFTDVYDEKQRTWVPRYEEKSMEQVAVNYTNQLIKGIEEKDIYFRKAPQIRKSVANKLTTIVNGATSHEEIYKRIDQAVADVIK